jgi:hypothetical protein
MCWLLWVIINKLHAHPTAVQHGHFYDFEFAIAAAL